MRSRSRLIATVASLLACVAMVGTGFASWVILAEDKEEATGNVKAEAVSENSLTFTVAPTTDANIFFAGPATQETPGAWLSSQGEASHENLSVEFTLSVTGKVGTIDIMLEETGLTTAIEANYITGATFAVSSATNNVGETNDDVKAQVTLDGTTIKCANGNGIDFTNGEIKVTMTYGWGTMFDSKNPYNFFNEKDRNGTVDGAYETAYSGKTWAEAAKEVLTDLYTDLNSDSGVSITVTFTAKQAA